jgi:hypothetical protein
VLDANRFLDKELKQLSTLEHVSVGVPRSSAGNGAGVR